MVSAGGLKMAMPGTGSIGVVSHGGLSTGGEHGRGPMGGTARDGGDGSMSAGLDTHSHTGRGRSGTGSTDDEHATGKGGGILEGIAAFFASLCGAGSSVGSDLDVWQGADDLLADVPLLWRPGGLSESISEAHQRARSKMLARAAVHAPAALLHYRVSLSAPAESAILVRVQAELVKLRASPCLHIPHAPFVTSGPTMPSAVDQVAQIASDGHHPKFARAVSGFVDALVSRCVTDTSDVLRPTFAIDAGGAFPRSNGIGGIHGAMPVEVLLGLKARDAATLREASRRFRGSLQAHYRDVIRKVLPKHVSPSEPEGVAVAGPGSQAHQWESLAARVSTEAGEGSEQDVVVATGPMSHGHRVLSYRGHLALHFIRESENLAADGGFGQFNRTLRDVAMVVTRAHARSLGGNGVLSWEL